jgi:hypothetical protein
MSINASVACDFIIVPCAAGDGILLARVIAAAAAQPSSSDCCALLSDLPRLDFAGTLSDWVCAGAKTATCRYLGAPVSYAPPLQMCRKKRTIGRQVI